MVSQDTSKPIELYIETIPTLRGGNKNKFQIKENKNGRSMRMICVYI
jgi:hypothetical protein